MIVSKRISRVPASPIRKLVPFAVEAKNRGITVYHLNIGDPDIKTPDVMLSTLKGWERNPIGYAQSQGEPVLLDSLKQYYHGIGASFLEQKHIQVTSGGSEAIAMALFGVAEAGDEVLVFEPFYTNYNSYAAIHGITLVPITSRIEDGFHLPVREEIERVITDKTKAILFCNPSNPTGTVYRRDEVELLVGIAKDHGLFLLSDEAYREYVFDGVEGVSLLEYMQEIPEQALVLDSLSKRYSLCGARIGTLVSLNEDLMAGVLRMGQGRLSSGLIDQVLAAKLTEVPESYIPAVQVEYQKRRDVIYEGLRSIEGITIHKPEGAFYAVVGLPVEDAEHFCQWLLTDFSDPSESSGQAETVMLAPAAGFYATPNLGKNEVRIAYVLKEEDLRRCVELIRLALERYLRQ